MAAARQVLLPAVFDVFVESLFDTLLDTFRHVILPATSFESYAAWLSRKHSHQQQQLRDVFVEDARVYAETVEFLVQIFTAEGDVSTNPATELCWRLSLFEVPTWHLVRTLHWLCLCQFYDQQPIDMQATLSSLDSSSSLSSPNSVPLQFLWTVSSPPIRSGSVSVEVEASSSRPDSTTLPNTPTGPLPSPVPIVGSSSSVVGAPLQPVSVSLQDDTSPQQVFFTETSVAADINRKERNVFATTLTKSTPEFPSCSNSVPRSPPPVARLLGATDQQQQQLQQQQLLSDAPLFSSLEPTTIALEQITQAEHMSRHQLVRVLVHYFLFKESNYFEPSVIHSARKPRQVLVVSGLLMVSQQLQRFLSEDNVIQNRGLFGTSRSFIGRDLVDWLLRHVEQQKTQNALSYGGGPRNTVVIPRHNTTETARLGFVLYGAQVRTVDIGGPADLAGLREGDLIISINGQSVRNLNQAAITKLCRTSNQHLVMIVEERAEVDKPAWTPRLNTRSDAVALGQMLLDYQLINTTNNSGSSKFEDSNRHFRFPCDASDPNKHKTKNNFPWCQGQEPDHSALVGPSFIDRTVGILQILQILKWRRKEKFAVQAAQVLSVTIEK
eukprot:m.264315 g.264315  ORF g.264315 m.264315 type:complete len:610 (+) comp27706_c0_seq1:806-2635(+)